MVNEEDSEDLQIEDVVEAIDTDSRQEFKEHLERLRCATCGNPFFHFRHALRRRSPHLYSLAYAECPEGHSATFSYVVDWLKS